LLLVCACTWLAPGWAQSQGDDPVTPLLRQFEAALNSGEQGGFSSLFAAEMPVDEVRQFTASLFMPGAVKTTLRERDRMQLEGAPPGDGYSLIVEFFIETPGRARVLTANMDVRRPPEGDLASWRFVGAETLTFVDGLFKLRLNSSQPLSATNLEVTAEDFVLTLLEGTVFLVESDDGVTGVVLLGRGEMRFSPTAAAERGQLRLFSGDDTLNSPFDRAFVRFNPADYDDRVATASLRPAAPDSRLARRAADVMNDHAKKSFNVDVRDMSDDDWFLLPPIRDFLAEVNTRRFNTLTYTLTADQAEDITVFRRRDRRTLALYPSVGKLAARGRFYSDDTLRDYDIQDYNIEGFIDPGRQTIQARARLSMRVRTTTLGAVRLRLADSLTVTGITSVEYGRLLYLRLVGQNMVFVNLPDVVQQDSDLTLVITYEGRVEPQDLDLDTISLSPDAVTQDPLPEYVEPSFLLSNRGYWYPQNPVPDYATASIRIAVPEGYTCVASGHPEPAGSAGSLNDILLGWNGPVWAFRAAQPVRYLALVISRLTPVLETRVEITNPSDPGSGVDAIAVAVAAQPALRGRARSVAADTENILRFYASVMGDAPYTSATVTLLGGETPGGHSPGYFAAISEPLVWASVSWRGDPASFDNYPEFFLAHELAHQWWGQAIGWKNYHEQWLSEGLSQYFAALYAREARGPRVFTDMLRQFRRWSISESDQGPVHLGSRLGHVKSEPRVFRALVYNKGAAVAHMLRRLLGDETFFRGLRRFYMDRRYQKAGTEDFERAFELESGLVLDRFFERWIYGSGIPRLRYSTAVLGGEVRVVFEQTGGEIFDVPVTVTISYADGQALEVVVPVTDARVERTIPTTGVVRRVEVNDDGAALAEFDRR
jgi:hypothetical protein